MLCGRWEESISGEDQPRSAQMNCLLLLTEQRAMVQPSESCFGGSWAVPINQWDRGQNENRNAAA